MASRELCRSSDRLRQNNLYSTIYHVIKAKQKERRNFNEEQQKLKTNIYSVYKWADCILGHNKAEA